MRTAFMKPPASKIRKGLLVGVEAIVGAEGYSTTLRERANYSRDANFRSAIEAHYAQEGPFPAVIVWPATPVQLSQIVRLAGKFNVPVTPYGGGSGVCAGAVPEGDGIVVDMRRMARLVRVDEHRLFAEAECGIYGLNLEKELNRRGFTMGHFPASIMVATLGGYIATRSAGQCSSKYGKIEDMIIDLEFVDGKGDTHATSDVSRNSGLDFTQAFIGSEGTLGIAVRARFKIHPLPAHRRFRSFRFRRFEYGAEAMRRIMQSGIQPDVLRLYDELDTLTIFPKGGKGPGRLEKWLEWVPRPVTEFAARAGERLKTEMLRWPRLVHTAASAAGRGCLMVTLLEGHPKLTRRQMEVVETVCSAFEAADEGEGAAQHWFENRYAVSFKASRLFMEGAFTDTMEVAAAWDNLIPLYHGVRQALERDAAVLAHVSHAYPDGAGMYFTFAAPLTGLGPSLKRYDRLWQEGLKAVIRHDGVISHHHGIGRLKSPFLAREWGDAARLYARLKAFFDPRDILNPSVLLPRETERERRSREAAGS